MPNANLSNVVTALLVGLSFGIGLLAVMFLFGVLRPQPVRRGSETVRTSPGRCLLVGLLTLLVCIGGFMVFRAMRKPGAVLSVALALVFAYWILNGLTMLAHSIGERVQTALMAKSLGSDAMAVVYGAVPLLAVGFLPVLGQLIQLVVITIGLGGAMSVLFVKSKPPVAQA
jgi:hypothetical protein